MGLGRDRTRDPWCSGSEGPLKTPLFIYVIIFFSHELVQMFNVTTEKRHAYVQH